MKKATLTVKMEHNDAQKLKTGDTIGTTTSTSDYDSYNCVFSDKCDTVVTVQATHVFKDYRNYIEAEHESMKGCGFDRWLVTKVLDKRFPKGLHRRTN